MFRNILSAKICCVDHDALREITRCPLLFNVRSERQVLLEWKCSRYIHFHTFCAKFIMVQKHTNIYSTRMCICGTKV